MCLCSKFLSMDLVKKSLFWLSASTSTVHHDGQVKTAQKREAAGHFAYRDRKQTVMNTSAHCPQHWLYLLRPGLPPCEKFLPGSPLSLEELPCYAFYYIELNTLKPWARLHLSPIKLLLSHIWPHDEKLLKEISSKEMDQFLWVSLNKWFLSL